MARRVLRSAALLKDVAATTQVLEPPSTPKKRRFSASSVTSPAASPKKSPSKSPRKSKYTFKQWEDDLAKRHPAPPDNALPESFVSQHLPQFVSALEHILKVDPSLYPLIVDEPFTAFSTTSLPCSGLNEHHARLCRSVIGQQVSGAAARSIELKFKALFGDKSPTPEQVLAKKDEELRSAGLSARKCEYIKSISQKFVESEVNEKFFHSASDQEVIEKLVEMKGIGEWSAKMFMVFGLHRLDVFAYDDLGVARGMSRYLETRPHLLKQAIKEVDMSLHKKKGTFHDNKKRDWKVHHDAYVNHIADAFQPYRSALMLILWRASSTNIEILDHD